MPEISNLKEDRFILVLKVAAHGSMALGLKQGRGSFMVESIVEGSCSVHGGWNPFAQQRAVLFKGTRLVTNFLPLGPAS